jgi:hypothetical protein
MYKMAVKKFKIKLLIAYQSFKKIKILEMMIFFKKKIRTKWFYSLVGAASLMVKFILL